MKILFASAALILLLAIPVRADISQILPLHEQPRTLPEIVFENDANRLVSLADYRGKVIVLNFWATWCLPCLVEMPTLDNLQGKLGSDKFEVLAMSVDRGGAKAVRKFYAQNGIVNLRLVMDRNGILGRGYKVQALPTTIIIDQQGREISRLVGSTEWDTQEMIDFFSDLISQNILEKI